ncbi:GIY-YIG nuclease family protein [Luteimonas sp. SX5]|uniref:GIY-YIG nuclease family protein n=1 Tax=Luteimonas galliterrae TaxID=2940486 RepID=A0ABT0MGU1_9GAMM|nr:GIY-YIG nuclease family protein [Luteimonas galliterrae]MCL1633520.1 GIY-YIG nuclease family protein [Luteimonas galliterrae]
MTFDDQDDANPRTLSRGACFLYVAPCVYDDILKVGFARDPLLRLHQLHRRFYEFFDLDAAFLIQTDTVREARALETAMHRVLAIHNAPAPLTIREPAGGATEWYRGAYGILRGRAHALADEGYVHHPSLRPWLRERLLRQSTELYSWAETAYAALSLADADMPAHEASLRQAMRDTLDAYAAFDIDLAPVLPEDVLRWYRAGR